MSCSTIGREVLRLFASLLMAIISSCSMLSSVYADEHREISAVLDIRLHAVLARPDPIVQGEYLASLAALMSLYRGRDFTPVWLRGGRLGPQAAELLALIEGAGGEGLAPHNYHLETLRRLVEPGAGRTDVNLLAETDLILTDAFVAYVGDVRQGRTRGHSLRKKLAGGKTGPDMSVLLSRVSSDGVDAAMSSLPPRTPAYARLREALPHYRALSAAENPFSIPERTLERGDTGAAVAVLKRRLGFLGDLHAGVGAGEVFDGPLERAVVRFQTRHGLKTDGIVGPKTNAALAVPMAHRVSQIEYSLERLRWLPSGSRYIVVNIAGFLLQVVERDEPLLQMRAIVGKPLQQTPVLSSRVTSLVLNPYWNVPRSIATKEMLPRLRRDLGYLQRENLRVLRSGGGTVVVDPATIDWHGVSRSNFPYRLRQDPGPDNALGQVKFFLPNPYSVFIHDTPTKSLFSLTTRALSHGCVRLEKPFDLAAYLLQDQPEWSRQRIMTALDHVRDKWVNLTKPIPIHMVYWTAWVDSQGIMQFRSDIYRRDQHLSLVLEDLSIN